MNGPSQDIASLPNKSWKTGLQAYCEIGVKYWKYVFELETNNLLTMNNEDRLRANEGLEQSIQRSFRQTR